MIEIIILHEIAEYIRIAEKCTWSTGYEQWTSKYTEYWAKTTERKGHPGQWEIDVFQNSK